MKADDLARYIKENVPKAAFENGNITPEQLNKALDELKIPHRSKTLQAFLDGKIDDLVKSQKSRHSCESRSPELLELTGFPLSRE